MAMTPVEMIDFFGERAELTRRGMAAASSSSNYYLAAVNCREAFKCRLMQGLIRWRLGNDPTESLIQAVHVLPDDWNMLVEFGGEKAAISDTPAEKAGFVSYIVGEQSPPCAVEPDDLEGDRLLDAILGNALFGMPVDDLWDRGMNQLQQTGSSLAVDTYELYREMLTAPTSGLGSLMEEGGRLFKKRKTESFFSGGDQTEGGGPDNDVTTDYRLAALAKRAGYEGAGMHAWRW
jgi:hypothetical protein